MPGKMFYGDLQRQVKEATVDPNAVKRRLQSNVKKPVKTQESQSVQGQK